MCQKCLCTAYPFKVPPKIWPKTYVTATQHDALQQFLPALGGGEFRIRRGRERGRAEGEEAEEHGAWGFVGVGRVVRG